MTHAHNETSAPYTNPDTRTSLEAVLRLVLILDGCGGRVGLATALAALDELPPSPPPSPPPPSPPPPSPATLAAALATALLAASLLAAATLARGLLRRVDPLAERQGALAAAHAADVVRPSVRLEAGLARSTRLLLASTPYRTPPTRVHRQFALLAVCRCILVLEDQLACSTSTRLVVAVHRAAASLSTAQRARGRVVA